MMEADINPDNSIQRSIVSYMLLPGESIVRVAEISRGIYWKGFAALMIALALLLRFGFWLGLYSLTIAGILLLLAYWTKKYLVLAATDHRVIIRAGILNQEVLQLRYPQIESVDTFYSPPGLALGYGSVVITGTGQSRWIVPFVRDADVFRDMLMQKLLEREEPLMHPVTAIVPQHVSLPL